MFERGILDLPNPIYRAWVVLKLAAVGSPQESFDFVLEKRVPKNLPRPKPKIKRIQPDGEQRYHMQSKGWMDILESREAADAAKNNNNSNNTKRASASKKCSKPKAASGVPPSPIPIKSGPRKTKKKVSFSSIPCTTCLSTSHKCIICQEKCCALCKAAGELNGHVCRDCFSTRCRLISHIYFILYVIIIISAAMSFPSRQPRIR